MKISKLVTGILSLAMCATLLAPTQTVQASYTMVSRSGINKYVKATDNIAVYKHTRDTSKSLIGTISSKGKFSSIRIDESDYDNVTYYEKYIVVGKDSRFGILNLKGEAVTDIIYSYISIINNKYAVLYEDNEVCSIMNLSNMKYIVKPETYDFISAGGDSDEYACVEKDEKSGVVNIKTGKLVVNIGKYDIFYCFNKYALVYDDSTELFGILNIKTGKLVVKCKYDSIYTDEEGYNGGNYIVVENSKGKCGVVNLTTGKEVIKCKYNEIDLSDTSSGNYAYAITSDYKTKWINISNDKELKVDKNEEVEYIYKNYAVIEKNGDYGIKNLSTGKYTVKLGKYTTIDKINKGFAFAKTTTGKTVIINVNGKITDTIK
jgi:hypothetical protein